MTGHTPTSESKALTERLDINFALKAARLGVWELDPVTKVISWDDRCRDLFGLAQRNELPYEQAVRHMHPNDVDRVNEAVRRAMNAESGGGYDVTYRTIGADDGRLRWVRFMGQGYFNEAGEVYRFAGVAQDVTDDVLATQRVGDSEKRFRSLIEEAPVATCLFVGRELVIEVANLPMQAIWGKGDTVLGKPLAQALPELVGQPFLQILDEVYTTGQTYQVSAAPCDLVRNGQLGTYYFDFTYKPLRNAAGDVYAIMDMATEVTEQVIAQKKLQESEAYFRQLTDVTPAIIWMTEPGGYCSYLNKSWYAYTGQTPAEAEGFGWLDVTHPDDREASGKGFVEANQQQVPFSLLYRLRNTDGQYRWAIDQGHPRFGANGTYEGMIGTVVDVHEQITTARELEASEARLRSIIATAPAAMGLFVGRDLVVELPNQAFIDIVGKGPDIAGQPLRQVMPELITENQPFLQILDDVYTSGKMFQSFGSRVDIVRHGVMTHNFYNITYSPLFDADGQVYAILDIAIDVTEEIKARQKLEESELFARAVIEHSPVAKAVFVGPEMVFQIVNAKMLELLGQDDSVVGKPFLTGLPALAQTQAMRVLQSVYQTGQVVHQSEEKYEFVKHGVPYTGFYNLTYQPLRDTNGQIYGIINSAVEVTEQVLERQKLEETEGRLRGAIELAELATWRMDIETGRFTYSARFMDWLGFSEKTKSMDEAYNPLPDDYRQSVADAIAEVVRPGSSGLYENEHPIINRLTGQVRIIHAQAQVFYDATGAPTVLSGTAQDVTEQRRTQLALEQQVEQRTEELAVINEELEATNEELAATNEELMATNEELIESTQQLVRSNDNLQRFAYVASHDLQEPLRKIQQFGDLLKNRYGSELGEGVDYLERMQSAASRMSTLIRDLLTFSRISTQRDTNALVPLQDIVREAVNDLDLRIQETGAVVNVETLPAVHGDASQLGQLFQNLLSNALKFRKPGVAALVRVSAQEVAAGQLPPSVKPTRTARSYYRINVTDNGIGFDDKYVDRIFQVFQRLHGKNQYAGTGIGLAICEKVAANHGGAISAISQPGQGATFSVYLPA